MKIKLFFVLNLKQKNAKFTEFNLSYFIGNVLCITQYNII